MMRASEKQKLGVRVQNPWSRRVRTVLLPQSKRGWATCPGAVQGRGCPGEGLKAKDAVPPRSSGSKRVPAPLGGKTEAPKGPRRPGMPTKSSSSNTSSKKAETES